MQANKQKTSALQFAEKWKGHGYEKGESQSFWIDLLHDVLGVERPTDFINFEHQVQLSHTSFIDAYIATTKVLIEQKSIDKDLRKPIPQSDGTLLTPFQQAKRYAAEMPYSKRPRWVVVCNFQSFLIYDMEQPQGEPFEVLLQNLGTEYDRLRFLVEDEAAHLRKEMEVSFMAGELVGKLYESFLKQYKNPEDPQSLRSLNILCVRLVFCLYSEDAGLFGPNHSAFYDYLRPFPPQHMRRALIDLFDVLDTPLDKRDPYLDDVLAKFPYVAGGLFQEKNIEIPNLTPELADLLLERGSDEFDWAQISPTIFGAVFESTLNPETRRSGGMHYTSIENIHKVIDPLFLDELHEELHKIVPEGTHPVLSKPQKQQLSAFQNKLASLKFLDPACGSGNFLTETYLSLRRLENQVISLLNEGQAVLDFADPIKVNINQFYGIEINDFAVTVAATALWIAEAQMWQETENIVQFSGEFLPLRSYSNIHEGNALRMNWAEDVIKPEELNYIMGNPPFIGARMMEQGGIQKKDIEDLFGTIKDVQDLDYVCGWYKKAAQLIQNTDIQVGFVSTNSICQGSQVPILWNVLLNEYHIHINFAWQTFKWNSESTQKAAVHCVIVGFGFVNNKAKELFISDENYKIVANISPYLTAGADTFVVANKEAICDVPKMNFGNQPRDGGFFILKEEDREQLLADEPGLAKWIRPYIGAEEFINGKKRYCLWLKKASPSDIKSSKILYERVMAVKAFREASKAKTTNGYAKVPHLFAQLTQPDDVDYIIVPSVSSERRRYVPIGFLNGNVISSNAVQILPNATLFHFGVLTSNVHMAWMRLVCGRLKSDYRYSKEIVYNPFPWPTTTEAKKAKIEQTAQAIIDARALYPDSSLADLYDEVTMPPELRKAHQQNDRAVMEAYGFPIKNFTESDCVAKLLEMYQELTK